MLPLIGAAAGLLGGGGGGGMGPAPISSSSGDVSAGFTSPFNVEANLTVGGSGKTSASRAGDGAEPTGSSSTKMFVAIGAGIFALILVLVFASKK